VDGRIGRVLELLRQEKALRVRRGKLFGAPDRAHHALGAGREDQAGPERGQHAATLDAHRLRHGQRQLVAARRRHIGQRDARVAARGFNNLHAGFENAALFRVPHHGRPDAALDRVGGVATLNLGQHNCLGVLHDAVEFDQGGFADRFRVVPVYIAHTTSLRFNTFPFDHPGGTRDGRCLATPT